MSRFTRTHSVDCLSKTISDYVVINSSQTQIVPPQQQKKTRQGTNKHHDKRGKVETQTDTAAANRGRHDCRLPLKV